MERRAYARGTLSLVPVTTGLILRQCIDRLQYRLISLFHAFLQELPAALSLMAATVQTDSHRKAYLEALAAFQVHQEKLAWRFRQRLAEPLSPGAADASLLMIGARQAFEGGLALKVMVTKAETQYRGELLMLKMRLDQAGIASQAPHLNPFGPHLIGLAFQEALQPLELGAMVENTCFRLFERQVMGRLGPLYEELNQVLIRHGVLPDLDLSRYLTRQPGPRQKTEPRSQLKQAGEASTVLAERALSSTRGVTPPRRRLAGSACNARESLSSTFRSLVRLMHLAQEAAAEIDEAAVVWSPDEISRALHQLCLSPVQPDQSLTTRLISCLRQRQRFGERQLGLPRMQRESLQLLDLFFDGLLQCEGLTDAAQAEIRRLDVAVFNSHQRDPWLFEKPEAPVLRLLELLARLDRRGTLLEKAGSARVHRQLTRIAREAEPEDAIIEEVIQELELLLQEQEQQFLRAQQRYQAAAEGARKVAEAHQVADHEIERRLGGKQVPVAVWSLIQEGWRELLRLTHLRDGTESVSWRQYLQLLDRLLEPESIGSDTLQVLEQVRAGLGVIASSPQQVERLCRELESYLAGGGWKTAPTIQAPVVSPESALRQEIGSVSVTASWLARVQKHKVGDWFRWQGADGQWEQVTLAWIAPGFGQFLLVSRLGQKVADLGLREWVEQLRNNSLQPTPDYTRPLLDQALGFLVEKAYGRLLKQAVIVPVHKAAVEVVEPLGEQPPDQAQLLLRAQKILPLHGQSRVASQYHIQFGVYDRRGQWLESEAYRQAIEPKGWSAALDRQVLERSLEWMDCHPGQVKRLDSLWLSLSGDLLREGRLLEFLYERLAHTRAPLDKICFDFDEAVARQEPDVMAAFMEEFREYGCRFALRCPGWDLAGHSLWRQLPLDFIRVDLGWIPQLVNSQRQQAVLAGLAEVAHLAGLELVGTGVESRACLELLKSLGLDYAQGSGIEKPRQLSSL